MRQALATITLAVFAVHAVAGCCWHHHHASSHVSSCAKPPVASCACPCQSDERGDARQVHGDLSADGPCWSAREPSHGGPPEPCSEPACVFAGSRSFPRIELRPSERFPTAGAEMIVYLEETISRNWSAHGREAPPGARSVPLYLFECVLLI